MAELPTGTVTLLFTDIEGSTRLLRRVGDAYAGLLSQHRSLLEEAFLAHRGVVVDQEGDAFFVAFASAKDAVAAAADAQRALVVARLAWTRTRSACGSACTPASRVSSRAATSGSTSTTPRA